MRYMDANKIIGQYVYMCAALRSGHQEESHGTHAVIGWECPTWEAPLPDSCMISADYTLCMGGQVW